jgi:hypothetical protein
MIQKIKVFIQNRFKWIVNEEGELGFRFCFMNFWYYKWAEPMLSNKCKWRYAEKREFGEVIYSIK